MGEGSQGHVMLEMTVPDSMRRKGKNCDVLRFDWWKYRRRMCNCNFCIYFWKMYEMQWVGCWWKNDMKGGWADGMAEWSVILGLKCLLGMRAEKAFVQQYRDLCWSKIPSSIHYTLEFWSSRQKVIAVSIIWQRGHEKLAAREGKYECTWMALPSCLCFSQ